MSLPHGCSFCRSTVIELILGFSLTLTAGKGHTCFLSEMLTDSYLLLTLVGFIFFFFS